MNTVVLMFHSIGKKKSSLVASKEKLITIIEFFNKRNYIFTKLSDTLQTPRNRIILTFDDGYKDNYEIVLPVIQKYNIPITIFISTGFIGSTYTDSCGIEHKMLSINEIKELSNSQLVEIGAHSITHRNLSNLTTDEQTNEILGSIDYLEKLLHKKIISFAYPRGKYNNETLNILKSTTIKYAVTVKDGCYGRNDKLNNLEIKRINITNNFSKLKLYIIHHGLYGIFINFKKVAKKCLGIFLKK